ncbi:translation factor (SUA5) [Roseivirga seohaensis]|uniref:Threonylcarbamoyl-AMP synthase n=1 Tax=Roseivirga seohaensis TaxID=1914963 RepID=A0A150Y4B9_9BACT|nr:L-threonylcarbamoyladenylate synthase [Roseivirga seohaensis]KYG85817.1 translation factor (SUA5) [Roseivirga seohaensis]
MAIIGVDISAAKSILEQGDLVAIPTETVYGLAGNAFNIDAVAKIFKTKNRPTFDPLIVHVNSLERLSEFTEKLPEKAVQLTNAFWPGPLTILLKKKAIISDLVTAGLDTVAVRMPRHELTRELLKGLDFPLAAPSANPFGYISPTSAQHVQQQLGDKIDYILDGGECGVGVESTIVSFEDKLPKVLRLGGISIEEIEQVIGKVEVNSHSSSQPQAPGMLKSHYAPKKKILAIDDLDIEANDLSAFGFLGFSKPDHRFKLENQIVLSESENLNEAAKNLFGSLRTLDQNPNIHTIVVSFVPEMGLGRAINDRLRRATAK